MSAAVHIKQLSTSARSRARGDGTPTAEQVAAINAFTVRDFAAEQLYVREFAVCHNCMDRDRETIDETLLDSIAATLPGKGLFVRHPVGWDGDSGPGTGRWFSARVEKMPLSQARELLKVPDLQLPPDRNMVHVVMAETYLTRVESKRPLIDDIDAGIAPFVSIGFAAAGSADVIDPVSKNRVARRLVGPGEAREASLVWLGAQPGAGVTKFAPTQGKTMDPTQFEALKAAIGAHALLLDNPAALKAALDNSSAYKAANDLLSAIKAALGGHAALLDTPSELRAAIETGVSAKAALVDDLIKADRLAKRCGDDDASVTARKAIYQSMPIEALKVMTEAVAPAPKPTGAIQGSDPNATKAALPNGAPSTCDVPADIAFLA